MSLLRNTTVYRVEMSRLRKFGRTLHERFKSTVSNAEEVQSTVLLKNGRKLILSTGKYARMANGACVVQSGDTAVMATAVSKTEDSSQSSSSNFLPLTVNFKMKYAAAGRIPMNHFRRERAPSEREILTARIIDRSIRPLFPPDYSSKIQIVSNLLAADGVNDPEVLCINAASLALALSDIPWDGPVGAVRVGLCNDEVVMNPTRQELEESRLNLVITGKASHQIVMVEASCEDVGLNEVMHALKEGLSETQNIIKSIEEISRKIGNCKQKHETRSIDCNLLDTIRGLYKDELVTILTNYSLHKQSRDILISTLKSKVIKEIFDMQNNPYQLSDISYAADFITKEVFRNLVFETDVRCDGRSLEDIRSISCGVDLYKPLHGSALFQRGQTQVLCTVTLDSPQSAIKLDTYSILTSGIKEKNFFLHYEFPSYAVNDISNSGGIDRREIGHGALAERGLCPVVPKDFPFSIRLTSEVLESNGSSSMASVCGGTLALLDAGVPLSEMAAGVAMGLLTRKDENHNITDHRILTDILGMEDYMGDMDLKIAGTKCGFTALQADFKIGGIPLRIFHDALIKGHAAKQKILQIMKETISAPRNKEENMPMMEVFEVPAHKRAKLTGPGHINLKRLFAETGVQITPLEDMRFSAFAPNETAMQEAYEIVRKLMETETEPTLDFGAIYSVKITEVRETGIMVTIHPKLMPVFIPNSQLDSRKVVHPSALGLEVGQKISVKYFGRDPAGGFIRLSRRVLLGDAEQVYDLDHVTSNPPFILREKVKSDSESNE